MTRRVPFLLGLASFIPGIGLPCAVVAVVWGLADYSPGARKAVRLALIGGALQLVAGAGLAVWLLRSDPLAAAAEARARKDLAGIVEQLEAYRARTGAYPVSLDALGGAQPVPDSIRLVDLTGGLRHARPYFYSLGADGTYDLLATGPDRVVGTPDDIRPALADSAARPGYRPRGP
ncbi:MAG: hypothetical protein AB7S39_23390 [Gemmatimonadales bacterium]